MKRVILALVVTCFLFGSAQAAGMSNVVTSVTTNDVNKAAMAIKFTHAIMKKKGMQATLFFNVYGVALVNKNRPSPIYPTGESIKDMLDAFMKDGGTILACPMCMKNIGAMTNADLIEGVASMEGGGLQAITAPDTLVLSY